MKGFFTYATFCLFFLNAIPATADDLVNAQATPSNDEAQQLPEYVKYLGGYLGYDVTKDPATNAPVVPTLLNITDEQNIQTNLFKTLLGAIPVNAISDAFKLFVPANTTGMNSVNSYANTTFSGYGGSSSQPGSISAMETIDQQTFQSDPINQAILNILGTPDHSYCNNSASATNTPAQNQKCTLLYQNKVLKNVVGDLPANTDGDSAFFSFKYNQPLLTELNSNALTGPLLYSTDNNQGADTNKSGNPGLTAQNQIQAAGNFIRFASASVLPVPMPKANDYFEVYIDAYKQLPSTATADDIDKQMQAQNTLNTYFANLRVYAAQTSVGLSNLYYIMSKRIPQNLGENNPSSEALSEFNMATWRIKPADPTNPDAKNTEWITRINKASPATVQKEIAILLAEMNYQLYLSRQQEERILLTNTMMLMQNMKTSQPNVFTKSVGGTGGAPSPDE